MTFCLFSEKGQEGCYKTVVVIGQGVKSSSDKPAPNTMSWGYANTNGIYIHL